MSEHRFLLKEGPCAWWLSSRYRGCLPLPAWYCQTHKVLLKESVTACFPSWAVTTCWLDHRVVLASFFLRYFLGQTLSSSSPLLSHAWFFSFLASSQTDLYSLAMCHPCSYWLWWKGHGAIGHGQLSWARRARTIYLRMREWRRSSIYTALFCRLL